MVNPHVFYEAEIQIQRSNQFRQLETIADPMKYLRSSGGQFCYLVPRGASWNFVSLHFLEGVSMRSDSIVGEDIFGAQNAVSNISTIRSMILYSLLSKGRVSVDGLRLRFCWQQSREHYTQAEYFIRMVENSRSTLKLESARISFTEFRWFGVVMYVFFYVSKST